MNKNAIYETLLDRYDETDLLSFPLEEVSEVFGLTVSDVNTFVCRIARDAYNLKDKVVSVAELIHKREQFLSLGDEGLDEFFGGGIPTRIVTEVSGVSGSGKTQLCMQLCAMATLGEKYGGLNSDVLVLATGHLFKAGRFKNICEHTYARFGQPDYFNALKRVRIIHISDADTLSHIIKYQLPHAVKSVGCKLLLISSITSVFRYSGEEENNRNELLLQIGIALKRIAYENDAAVICVNQAVSLAGDGKNKISTFGYETELPVLNDSKISINTDSLIGRSNLCVNFISDQNDVPSLGLLWQSITTLKIFCVLNRGPLDAFDSSRYIRISSPYHVYNKTIKFKIYEAGIAEDT